MPIRETLTQYWNSKGRWKYGVLALIALAIVIGLGLFFDAPGVRQCVTSADLEKCNLLGKTAWEWLELLGVPLSLALLGWILQREQQKRSDALAKEQRERDRILAEEQREIADDAEKEEILQTYFDRLSTLLIDKNLLAIAVKIYLPKNEETETQPQQSGVAPEQQELFGAAVDVIRARTLSILRRFADDPKRKSSVIQFLVETEVIGKAKINLSGADLSEVDLNCEVDLSGVDLRKVNLSGASLSFANLYETDLSGANLSGANLSGASLDGANLGVADLSGANLSGANLNYAQLSVADLRLAYLDGANLGMADLSWGNLSGADLRLADLKGADLKSIKWNEKTQWPDPEVVAKAQNIPEALKQQLGIE